MKRQIGDVILVYYEDQPAVFARIDAIEPDVKKEWLQLTLTLLTIPTQPVTWILRPSYIDGDPFTMGGKAMRLEKVKKSEKPEIQEKQGESSGKPGKVIPIGRDHRKES
jgi:hypothetical protein